MSYSSEFLIEDGILKEYYGSGGVIEVPQNVHSVAPFAFCYCDIEKLILPDNFARIRKEIFRRVKSLHSVETKSTCARFGKDLFEYAPGMPEIEALNMPIGDIPPQIKPNCCMGFARALEEGKQVKKEIKDGYLKYIKLQRKALFDAAENSKPLLRLMIKEKVFSRDDCDVLALELSDMGKTEESAIIMSYQRDNFKARDPIMEMMREMKRDPFSKREISKLWKYEETDEGIKIKAYLGNSSHVEVPSKVGKRTVNSIGDRIFCDEMRKDPPKGEKIEEFRSIIIPDSVTEIGREAFKQCEELVSVKLSEGIKAIPLACFSGCSAIEEIVLPLELQEIKMRAFLRCKSLNTVTIPKNVSYIGEYAFSECDSLKEVIFNDGIKNIDTEGFSDCHSLKSVELPEGLERLGYGAFGECENLCDVFLPQSINFIGRDAFCSCPMLTLHVFKGSYAHEYAKEHRLRYVER